MSPFVAVVVASLLSRLGYQMARSPVLPRFAESLEASTEMIGLIVAASTITGVFFKLPAGVLSDIYGRKPMMIAGGVFFAVPPFLYPFVEDGYSLLALRFVHGFATALFSPVASAYVAGLAQHGRGLRLGWFSSANDLGATAGPLVGGLVLFSTASFPATYLLAGLLGIVALLAVLRVPEEPRLAPEAREPLSVRLAGFGRGLREVAAVPAIFVASGAEAAVYLGFGAFLGFLPLYAADAGLNDAEIALVLAVQLSVALAVKPVAGRLSDRIGRKPVIVAGLIGCAAALPLVFRAEGLIMLLAVVPLLGLAVGAVTPVTNALIADLAAAERMGAAMGVFGTLWDIGESLGPILAGILIARYGYAAGFDAIAAVIAATAMGLAVVVAEPGRRRP